MPREARRAQALRRTLSPLPAQSAARGGCIPRCKSPGTPLESDKDACASGCVALVPTPAVQW